MGDIWKRATPGDPMSGFPAELYNLMLDCVKDYARKRNGGAQGTPETDRDTKIFIKNVSGADCAQCSVVGIGTAAVVPKSSKAYFFGKAVFESASPTGGEPFAILQDPIPDTKYGQARASGWSFVKVNLTSTAHEYADAAGVYTSLLSQAGVGPARIWWTNTPAATQLDGGINDSVVTITVDTNTNWPDPATEGSYVITIDTEDMQVTAHPTSTTRTVVRGYNSTTPAAHADNAAVTFKSGVVWAAVLLTGASGAGTGNISDINGETGPSITIAEGNGIDIVTTTDTVTVSGVIATASLQGDVSTTTQTFAGDKNFKNEINGYNIDSNGSNVGGFNLVTYDVGGSGGVEFNISMDSALSICWTMSITRGTEKSDLFVAGFSDGVFYASHDSSGTVSNQGGFGVYHSGTLYPGATTTVSGLDFKGGLYISGSVPDTTNASNISSGTLADARLSANVTLLGNPTPVADGTYTVGARLTGGGTDGTITTVNGIITAITEAT